MKRAASRSSPDSDRMVTAGQPSAALAMTPSLWCSDHDTEPSGWNERIASPPSSGSWRYPFQ